MGHVGQMPYTHPSKPHLVVELVQRVHGQALYARDQAGSFISSSPTPSVLVSLILLVLRDKLGVDDVYDTADVCGALVPELPSHSPRD